MEGSQREVEGIERESGGNGEGGWREIRVKWKEWGEKVEKRWMEWRGKVEGK